MGDITFKYSVEGIDPSVFRTWTGDRGAYAFTAYKDMASRGAMGVVAYSGDKIVGIGSIRAVIKPTESSWSISSLATESSGYGRQIMGEISRLAVERGCGLELTYDANAKGFYEKLGMIESQGKFKWTPAQVKVFVAGGIDNPTYDDWWNKYHEQVETALAESFEEAAVRVGMVRTEAHKLAAVFAKEHAGELLNTTGKYSMAAGTQERVKGIVANAIESGASLKSLSKTLTEDIAFSKYRADLVARTETAIAHGQGAREAGLSLDCNKKSWETQGATACDDCQANEDDGDIDIDDDFSSGESEIPAHPNCECQVRYFHGGD